MLLNGKIDFIFDKLLDKIPEENLRNLIKSHKKVALITASLPVTVPLFYFADVWAIGSLAAALYELKVYWNAISIFATPEEKAAALQGKILPYFFSHPFTVGWA
ncbi:hypothetical protein Dtox_2468 [Desulfofarcimen acetoxidans DSM 771]|uniref:Uncharacterized protein n=1 Tax=Desulfofarcimen acetoxidans (strain ATCC 49208 / DSM 771 / KCTC 5769 / VKM B-1644 / 5575) TaxID=485916 RepID=C8W0M2_DESAS|nr:hypothetical protein [Desulfofarcimen acetoxidans]ACV63277.1 hypothetical protein Dtox_2468 [Desulfofarcimen acetoxidans DSM 771]